jgi:hypothetical protein
MSAHATQAAEAVRAASEAVLQALESRRWEVELPLRMQEREAALQSLGEALAAAGGLLPAEAADLLALDARIGEALRLRRLELERERRALRTGPSVVRSYTGPASTASRFLDFAG